MPVGLALMADFALKNGPARFGTTELAVGVPFLKCLGRDACGSSPRTLRRLVYTAELFDFKSAYEMGVGDVLSEEPEEDARAWLKKVSSFPRETFQHTKQQMRQKASQKFSVPELGEMSRVQAIMQTEEVRDALTNALKR